MYGRSWVFPKSPFQKAFLSVFPHNVFFASVFFKTQLELNSTVATRAVDENIHSYWIPSTGSWAAMELNSTVATRAVDENIHSHWIPSTGSCIWMKLLWSWIQRLPTELAQYRRCHGHQRSPEHAERPHPNHPVRNSPIMAELRPRLPHVSAKQQQGRSGSKNEQEIAGDSGVASCASDEPRFHDWRMQRANEKVDC